jgi:hypothetical protein
MATEDEILDLIAPAKPTEEDLDGYNEVDDGEKLLNTLQTTPRVTDLPAEQAFKKLGISMRNADIWDKITPKQRDLMLQEIYTSDGMATRQSIMNAINGVKE